MLPEWIRGYQGIIRGLRLNDHGTMPDIHKDTLLLLKDYRCIEFTYGKFLIEAPLLIDVQPGPQSPEVISPPF